MSGCTRLWPIFQEWSRLFADSRSEDARQEFQDRWDDVVLRVSKSCLLDRMVHHEEKPSRTPCPVHKGKWSGIHIGWPGQKWSDGSDAGPSPILHEWHAAGCRCYLHGCGCTTGWQPDENCGCGVKP